MQNIRPSDANSVCQCGRDANKVHCPQCGKSTLFVLRKKTRMETVDGLPRKILAYACRLCGTEFDDIMRADCQAPLAEMRLDRKTKHVATKINDALAGKTKEERMEWTKQQLSMKQGILSGTPKAPVKDDPREDL